MIGTAAPAHGQSVQWVRQFGTMDYDNALAVTTDPSGDVYVGGTTRAALPGQTSAGKDDAFLAKYDLSGNVVWFRQFGTSGEDGILAEATDAAGYIYAAGFAGGQTSIAGTAGLLAKYDSAGNQLWMRQFGAPDFSTHAFSVAADAAGDLYLIGSSANIFGFESFLAKFSASGQQQWSRVVSGASHVATDNVGHVYVVSGTRSDAQDVDVTIAQYDALGNQVWLRQFGSAIDDFPEGVDVNALGDIYIAGRQEGFDPQASFLAQYDTAGNQHWVRSFTGENFPPLAMSVVTDATGNAFVGGFTPGTFPGTTSTGLFDAFVVQYDRAGTERWVTQFGTTEGEDVRSIAVDDTGNVYVAGLTSGAFPGETLLGGTDAFLARLVTAPISVEGRVAETRKALAGMTIAAGIRQSLDQKLASGQRSAATGRQDATCGLLTAFINEVSAQDGKGLTGDQAALLRSPIDAIRAESGCR